MHLYDRLDCWLLASSTESTKSSKVSFKTQCHQYLWMILNNNKIKKKTKTKILAKLLDNKTTTQVFVFIFFFFWNSKTSVFAIAGSWLFSKPIDRLCVSSKYVCKLSCGGNIRKRSLICFFAFLNLFWDHNNNKKKKNTHRNYEILPSTHTFFILCVFVWRSYKRN